MSERRGNHLFSVPIDPEKVRHELLIRGLTLRKTEQLLGMSPTKMSIALKRGTMHTTQLDRLAKLLAEHPVSPERLSLMSFKEESE